MCQDMNICKFSNRRCSFNGYTIGQIYSILGFEKTDSGRFVCGEPKQFTIGFNKEGMCDGFSMVFRDNDSGLPSFIGKVIYEGKEIEISVLVTPGEIRSLFGNETDDEWNDDVEINLQYLLGQVRVEFSWCKEKNNSLNYVDVGYD
jgi:hypothetical protein